MFDFLAEVWFVFVEMSPYLLLGISFVAILDFFVKKDFISRQVNKNNIASIVKTAIFGVPLPLCSCGVIPTSVYLKKSGASKPSVVSFLISTPQTGIDSIIATYGLLGPIFAIFRPIAAFAMGIFGGIVTMWYSKNHLDERDNSKDEFNFESIEINNPVNNTISIRLKKSLRYAFIEFIDDISNQFLFGLLIAGAISYFVPDDFSSLFKGNELLAMLSVIVFAIPMYVCATGSIPIALSLMMKGLSPGVAYVFLVAGPVTNAASLNILRKVLGNKLLILYVLTVASTSIIFGYLLNWIFEVTSVNPHTQMSHLHLHSNNFTTLDYIFATIFLILIVSSVCRKYFIKHKENTMETTAKTYKIEGMTCNHCVMNVERAIKGVPGVSEVKVFLNDGIAIVKGEHKPEEIKFALENIGYKFAGEK